MGDNLEPKGLSRGCKVLCSRSIYPKIVVHEADEPNALVDFLDPEALTGEDGRDVIRFRCMQMRPQAVTRTSRSWSG